MSKMRSEDVLGKKIDRCMADAFIKTLVGFSIGTVASVAIFKKRTWPIWIGTGIGIGMGWSNARHELQNPYRLQGKKVRITEADGKPSYQIVVQQQEAKE